VITDVLLSVILCARNQATEVAHRAPVITQFLDANFKNYELIIVDDGSSDNTSILVKELSRQQKNLRLLRLARHYGSGTAVAAGLQHAIGDYAAVMRLDDPLDAIPELLTRCKSGYDVVFAALPDNTPRSIAQRLAVWLGRVSHLPINAVSSNFVIMRRKAMNSLLTLKDRMHNIQVLAVYLGMMVDYAPVLPTESSSKQPWHNLLHMADAILAYSRWPLWWLGGTLLLLSLLGFVTAGINWILSGFDLPAGVVLGVSLLLLLTNGILFIMAAAVGRILAETKRQPLYYVTEEISSRTVEIASIVRAV